MIPKMFVIAGSLFFWTMTAFSQIEVIWERTYGDSGEINEYCQSVLPTSDGGFLVTGEGTMNTPLPAFKTDQNGDSLWNISALEIYYARAYDAIEVDGGYIICGGRTYESPVIRGYALLLKIDYDGNAVWSREYGFGEYSGFARRIIKTSDGNLMIAGRTSHSYTSSDVWLMKVDQNGSPIWSRIFRGQRDGYEIVEVADGFVIAGSDTAEVNRPGVSALSKRDFWLFKVDENGDSLWSKTYGGTERDQCYAMTRTEDGGFALAGFTNSFTPGDRDYWVVKADENGDSLWSETLGGERNDAAWGIVEMPDGGLLIAGSTWLVKLTADGDSLWSMAYGRLTDLKRLESGYIVAGYTIPPGVAMAGRDYWLIRLSEEEQGVNRSQIQPLTPVLLSCYPNPFNGFAQLSFVLDRSQTVSLSVYDVQGRYVRQLLGGSYPAGAHQIMFDGSGLSGGIYFVRLNGQSQKLILLR